LENYIYREKKDKIQFDISILSGFNILKPLPSYTVIQRFIKKPSNDSLKEIFKNQVSLLNGLSTISSEFA
jgi:hypothetical protein